MAAGGAAACHLGLRGGPFAGSTWLRVVAAGFEAATVGGFADWFAVTALFRHPLGLPIPHTAIIPARRAKIIEGIVTMVEEDWLSPDAISARLARLAPGALVVEWLRDPAHVERVSAPVRDVLRGLAPTLTGAEAVGFVERALQRQLRELPVDVGTGAWLRRAVTSDGAGKAFETVALSLANLAERPRTATQLHWWLDRSARTLRAGGQRLIPFVLRRRFVQRRLVEAACGYAAAELRAAAGDPQHPLPRAARRLRPVGARDGRRPAPSLPPRDRAHRAREPGSARDGQAGGADRGARRRRLPVHPPERGRGGRPGRRGPRARALARRLRGLLPAPRPGPSAAGARREAAV